MRKEKFVYNTQTLRYEKVVEPLNVKIFKAFGFLSAVFVTACIMVAIFYHFYPFPKETALMRELDQMKHHYAEMDNDLTLMSKVLSNVQDRDGSVHRMLFGMDPIDDGVWEGGSGGSDKYDDIIKYKNSSATLIGTEGKLRKLKLQLDIQSKSLDEIEKLASKREEQLASIPAIKPIREDKLKRSIRSLSGFGMRLHPVFKRRKMHTGIDFTCPTGTPIQATGDGVVYRVTKSSSGYGHHVVIDHGFGYKTLYGHMSRIDVKKGEKVTRGQTIGAVGSTGTSKEYQELANMASVANQSFD